MIHTICKGVLSVTQKKILKSMTKMKEIMMNFVINNLIVRSVNIKVKTKNIYLSNLGMTNLVGKSVLVDSKKMRKNMKWKLKKIRLANVNTVI